MTAYALPMSEAAAERIPELLAAAGMTVTPRGMVGAYPTLRCVRAGVGVLIAVSRPKHWKSAADQRRGLVVVATVGESILRFWRYGRENRLRREIVETLRPHGWRPTA